MSVGEYVHVFPKAERKALLLPGFFKPETNQYAWLWHSSSAEYTLRANLSAQAICIRVGSVEYASQT